MYKQAHNPLRWTTFWCRDALMMPLNWTHALFSLFILEIEKYTILLFIVDKPTKISILRPIHGICLTYHQHWDKNESSWILNFYHMNNVRDKIFFFSFVEYLVRGQKPKNMSILKIIWKETKYWITCYDFRVFEIITLKKIDRNTIRISIQNE